MVRLCVLLLLIPAACAWVKLDDAGARVEVIGIERAAECRKLGEARVEVRDRVLAVQRSPGRVATELETLGRNAAAEMGGTHIAPVGPVTDGSRRYAVLVCD